MNITQHDESFYFDILFVDVILFIASSKNHGF
jgi:hypothetical protein